MINNGAKLQKYFILTTILTELFTKLLTISMLISNYKESKKTNSIIIKYNTISLYVSIQSGYLGTLAILKRYKGIKRFIGSVPLLSTTEHPIACFLKFFA